MSVIYLMCLIFNDETVNYLIKAANNPNLSLQSTNHVVISSPLCETGSDLEYLCWLAGKTQEIEN